MIVKVQKKIEFINACGCIVDYEDLESAMVWYSDKPITRLKTIFLHGRYPGVAIYKEKIHVHRLLIQYWNQSIIPTNQHVHHLNGNKLDCSRANLQIIDASVHMSLHNAGKVLTDEHKAKIAEKGKLRTGIKLPK